MQQDKPKFTNACREMSTILEYFITVDQLRCQCVYCGKCFTLDSPIDIREKHFETDHPEGYAKMMEKERNGKPIIQGQTNVENISVSKPRVKTSKVWKFFHLNSDKTKVICEICGRNLTRKSQNTTTMRSHLIYSHQIFVEASVPCKTEKTKKTKKDKGALMEPQKVKPFEYISEYILKSDIKSTRHISNVRIYCKDGVVSTHKIFLASLSTYLSDLFLENDTSDLILPDFEMKEVLMGFDNFELKSLLGKSQLYKMFNSFKK